jgi:acetate kinase
MAKVLISNPGSASRKYAVFEGEESKLRLHFEHEGGSIIYSVDNGVPEKLTADIGDLSQTASLLPDLLDQNGITTLDAIALRIVAPSSYFLQHRHLDEEAVLRLREQQPRAPLHIGASLQELETLQKTWPDLPVLGISDSAFHATKPDYAWNYGIRLEDADAHRRQLRVEPGALQGRRVCP